MINTILLKTQLVVDSSVWEIPLMCLAILAAIALFYFYRIHIAYRMATKRHRDPLGWVLLSFFFSPVLTWIILLIVGDRKEEENE